MTEASTPSLDESIEKKVAQQVAQELDIHLSQVQAATQLLNDGATVPFIARYRKEATQGLTDTHLRDLEERLEYLRDLEQQKNTAISQIQSLEKLTPALEESIRTAATKQQLADLYLPYRPKRRSKAKQAIEAGLEPLARSLFADPNLDPEVEAQKFLNPEKKIETSKQALDSARQILIEEWSETPALVVQLRDQLRDNGVITSQVKTDKKDTKAAAKFKDYFEFSEKVSKIPSHRTLALFRARREGILDLSIQLPETPEKAADHPYIGQIQKFIEFSPSGRAADKWLSQVVEWTWRVKLQPKLENDLLSEIKDKADNDSIQVFAKNLKTLLMSAPAGNITTIGLDPGIRTGVKIALIDATGQVIGHDTIFPHAPKNKWDESKQKLLELIKTHNAQLIAIGNGTASRETDKLVVEIIRANPDLGIKKIVVSESGASVYSASEYASKELPGLDVSFRGAVSIARRLQDPLAELVKIEPKAIGVGQYQHDVSQPKLAKSLETVVEDCVNAVGVDVNTASAPLLARIAGLNLTIAQNLVTYRDANGQFASRAALTMVPRFGKRTFEQAAGFLRVLNSDNPLDASAVHPESYALVEQIAQHFSLDTQKLLAQKELLKDVQAEAFVNDHFGLPTVIDILAELDKPGRDPRPDFKAVEFRDDIKDMDDLKPDMIIDGVVTNVTNFGAFVDVGVHHDGLVHISLLADKFVSDPHQVVQAGDMVKVKVIGIDLERKRIDLSMRLSATPEASPRPNRGPQTDRQPKPSRNSNGRQRAQRPTKTPPKPEPKPQALPPGKTGTFADIFANLKK